MIASSTQSHVKQSAIFRPDSGPLLLDQNTRQNFNQLPPIQNVLPSVAQPDAIQRPRGSTLPSYHSPRTDHSSAPTNDSHLRSNRKDRSMTIGSRSRDTANVSLGDDGPAQGTSGISLPPIRLSKDSPPPGSFRGLPPIKAMLPSPSHMISMDSKSPTSPQSSQSLGPLSTSWSSHAYTSASSADITGRFPQSASTSVYDNQHHKHGTSRFGSSPASTTFDDESKYARSRESRNDTEIWNTPASNSSRQHLRVPPKHSQSLLSMTAPRQPGHDSGSATLRASPSKDHGGVDRYVPSSSQPSRAFSEEMGQASTSSSPAGRHSPMFASNRPMSLAQDDVDNNGEYPFPPNRFLRRGQDAPYPSTTMAHDYESESARLRQGETAGGKKRRSRATQDQLEILNGVYARTPFPSTVERSELAQRLNMTPRSVQIWFQNKRQGAKHNESRRRELPPLVSTASNNSPQMPNLVPLTLASMNQPLSPNPASLPTGNLALGEDNRRDSVDSEHDPLRGRARRRRMSVNDLLSQDARDEMRPSSGALRYMSRQGRDERDS
ncbi:homeobox-domain-containing protein [Serendipita vermifera]|nr:homeobox-domain-containing protein [Serendipita vermifera]